MSEPVLKRKRGRPSKHTRRLMLYSQAKDAARNQKTLGYLDSGKSHAGHLDLYEELMSEYLNHGVSQQSQLILRKIAFAADLPKALSCKSLLKLLNQTTRDLLLNELEVVVWAVFLDKLKWGLDGMDLQLFLLVSAFGVKQTMNHDVSHILPHVQRLHVDFATKFEPWFEQHSDKLNVKPKLLNKRFCELKQPIALKGENQTIDYNAFVDQILHTGPRINPLKVIISDEEIMKLYRAYKLNSKIVIDSFREEANPTLERLDSIVSQYPESLHAGEPDSNIITYASSSVLDRINSLCTEYFTHESTFNL